MRVAVVSDLHANLQAVEAVAKEIDDADVDEIWCLGDIVGYGANPREVLQWVEANADVVVKGNHDQAVASGDTEGFNPIAAAAARYHAQVLDPRERARLHDLPSSAQRSRGVPAKTQALLVHGSPDDELHEYVLPIAARARAPSWQGLADVLLMGHTHVPFVARVWGATTRGFEDEGFRERIDLQAEEPGPRALTVINPGSVGQPRDLDARASYAILDLDARKVELRRVAYDIDQAASAIRRAGLDPHLGQRLYRGT